MKPFKTLLNIGLLLGFLALIGAPLGAFGYLQLDRPEKKVSSTLSATSRRENEGYVSVVKPSVEPMVRTIDFTAFSGKEVSYQNIFELKNESDSLVNYKLEVLAVEGDFLGDVSLHFGSSKGQTEVAISPGDKASISLVAQGYFVEPKSQSSSLTFIIYAK